MAPRRVLGVSQQDAEARARAYLDKVGLPARAADQYPAFLSGGQQQRVAKGKGFQGAIKRHGQSRGPMSHGSRYHRRPGSMGPVAPNRVFKNKRLAGRMGGDRVTIQNLEVVKVDVERNVILIKGNIPGAKKSLITIKSAVKAK